jgi:acetyl/propionyl-CoA carboxylase alpha subunit
MMFKKVLIANRGEIAARIIRTAHKLGIKTVGIYAPMDKDSLPMQWANESCPLGDNKPELSYLNIPKIIEIAQQTGSDAIHPGYGFLSENPDFAAACEKAGLCFIGPSSKTIAAVRAQRIDSPVAEKGARRIDVQIAADHIGTVLYLLERDCSIQRNKQKMVIEAPCVSIDTTLRETLGKMAIQAAQSVHYLNVGTVEFLVDAAGNPLVIGIKARLQVEHTVTEEITGIDLVSLQFAIAMKHPMPISQSDIKPQGHAIEVHVYAADPENDFVPVTGKIEETVVPEPNDRIRVESSLKVGDLISLDYNPLLLKLIVRGKDRHQAIVHLKHSLEHVHILGIKNNLNFLRKLSHATAFSESAIDTHFLEKHKTLMEVNNQSPHTVVWAIAAVGALLHSIKHKQNGHFYHAEPGSPWRKTDQWRFNDAVTHNIRLRHISDGQIETLHIQHPEHDFIIVKESDKGKNDEMLRLNAAFVSPNVLQVMVDEQVQFFYCMQHNNTVYLFINHRGYLFEVLDPFLPEKPKS